MHREMEAGLICRYLTGESPTPRVMELYNEMTDRIATPMNRRQLKIWNTCMRHPWILPLIDAALAGTNRFDPIRHRLFVCLSILETQADYQHHFRPVNRNMLYLLPACGHLVASAFRMMAGKVILWIL